MASKESPPERSCVAPLPKRELDGFLQVTAVKALQFIKFSAHWTESVFWVLMLLICMFLAVRDVRGTCQAFASQETFTRMIVKSNHTLTIDKAIICVNFDPRFVNRSNAQLQRDAMSSKIVYLAANFNTSAVAFLYKAMKLLSVLSIFELGRTSDFEAKAMGLIDGDDLQELHDFFRLRNITVIDLTQSVGHWLCLAAQMQIETYSRGKVTNTRSPCEPEKISWFGVVPCSRSLSTETTFCVDIGEKISFESMLQNVVIHLHTKGLFLKSPNSTYDVGAYLDLSGDPVATDLTKDWIRFPKNHGCAGVQIGIDAEMWHLDRSASPCDPKATSMLNCAGSCDVEEFARIQSCNCTQTAWLYQRNVSRNERCFYRHSIEEQLACRRAAFQTDQAVVCQQSCLFPCKLRQYSIVTYDGSCNVNQNTDGTALELEPKQFSIPIFDEQLAVGVSELFSRIGGTCGLWLGVGMLGICHAMLFPVKLIVRCMQHRWCQHSNPAPSIIALGLHTSALNQ